MPSHSLDHDVSHTLAEGARYALLRRLAPSLRHEAVAPLQTIPTGPPVPQTTLNWLNVFYAIEWIAFAFFAPYFWYRLVMDAVEREAEIAAEAES